MSLSSHLVDNLIRIIQHEESWLELSEKDILRRLMKTGFIEPILELYSLVEEPVPVLVNYSLIYVPIGRVSIPFPDHRLLIFMEISLPEDLELVPIPLVEEPNLLDMWRRLFDSPSSFPHRPCFINRGARFDENNLELKRALLREIGLEEPKVELLEPFLPYAPPDAADYLEKVLLSEYWISFLEGLADLLNKAGEKIRRFIKEFPGLGFKGILIKGFDSFYIPDYIHKLLPTEHVLILEYDEKSSSPIARIEGFNIYRPLSEHGIILDLIPPSEDDSYIIKHEDVESSLRAEKMQVKNPLTGRDILLRIIPAYDIILY